MNTLSIIIFKTQIRGKFEDLNMDLDYDFDFKTHFRFYNLLGFEKHFQFSINGKRLKSNQIFVKKLLKRC